MDACFGKRSYMYTDHELLMTFIFRILRRYKQRVSLEKRQNVYRPFLLSRMTKRRMNHLKTVWGFFHWSAGVFWLQFCKQTFPIPCKQSCQHSTCHTWNQNNYARSLFAVRRVAFNNFTIFSPRNFDVKQTTHDLIRLQ